MCSFLVSLNIFVKVFNEALTGGNPHFLTGAGGFAQNFIFGYLGARIERNFSLGIDPILPSCAKHIKYRNINYMQTVFTLYFDSNTISITRTDNFSNKILTLYSQSNRTFIVPFGNFLTVPLAAYSLRVSK